MIGFGTVVLSNFGVTRIYMGKGPGNKEKYKLREKTPSSLMVGYALQNHPLMDTIKILLTQAHSGVFLRDNKTGCTKRYAYKINQKKFTHGKFVTVIIHYAL